MWVKRLFAAALIMLWVAMTSISSTAAPVEVVPGSFVYYKYFMRVR